MKKIFGWTAVGLMSVSAFAACSSDDDKDTTTTKAATVTSTESTGDSTAGSATDETMASADENEATVDKFCADVTDLAAKGPTASDYASKLQELTAQGASLGAAVAADPSLQTKLTDCLKKLVPGG